MSIVTDIQISVLAKVAVAVTGITTLIGHLPVSKIIDEELPHAQAFAPAMEVQEELIMRQERQLWAFTIMITTSGATQEEMLTFYDDIMTQLDVDRTLSDTVRWVKVPTMEVNERADSKVDRQTLAFEVVAEVLV